MSMVPEELRAHLANDCTNICHCWRVVRRDGVAFGFTDHDRALVIADQSYEPESGFAQSEARATMGMTADTVDVEGALSSGVLSDDDIADGLFDGATVETFLVNWQDTSQAALMRKAVIGRIVRADGRFIAELESVAASLDRPAGRYLRRMCDAVLGDVRCKVPLIAETYGGSGTVDRIVAPGTLAASGLGEFESGWFSHGTIVWTDGRLAGRTSAIVSHGVSQGSALIVLPATAPMPEPGDAFSIMAGCDKLFSTCKSKFANSENFRGFPHLPGNDAAYGYVTEGGQFDGGPIVP